MRRQDKRKLQLRLLVSLLCSTPISLWFAYCRNDSGRAIAALVAGAVFLFVATEFWRLKNTVSFWVATLAAASLQMVMVLAIPWQVGAHPKGSGLMFVVVLPNLLVVYGAFKLAARLAARHSSQTEVESPK